jgi:outer membrane protein assembly factor BamD (BamD/ComL family)
MAQQTFQRLLKEYPASAYWHAAKQMLMEIEVASLPPEEQQAARQRMQAEMLQQMTEQYKKKIREMRD